MFLWGYGWPGAAGWSAPQCWRFGPRWLADWIPPFRLIGAGESPAALRKDFAKEGYRSDLRRRPWVWGSSGFPAASRNPPSGKWRTIPDLWMRPLRTFGGFGKTLPAPEAR